MSLYNQKRVMKGIIVKKIIYFHVNIFITFILLLSQSVFSDNVCERNDDCKLKLRFEVGSSVRAGHERDKPDGMMFSSIFDIGKELSPRTNLSLRLLPIFGYIQEGSFEDIIGFGIGGALRIYFKEKQKKGFFTEINEVVCVHENKFVGNDSNINFYSSVGLGYQFCPNWDILLRFGHISNADLKSANEGVNLLGLGVGYTF